MSNSDWIAEDLHEGLGVKMAYRPEKVLLDEQTGQHRLTVFENASLGRILMLDGIVQLTLRDEFIYHEMMAHMPVMAHSNPESVLIIGGGDGGIAREILKHKKICALTLVDIDASVVEFSKNYFPQVSNGCFEDKRLEVHIGDGAAFVHESSEKYDIIIVDSTDPQGPGAQLYTSEFYASCQRCLAQGGIVVTQSGAPFFQREELVDCMAKLSQNFNDVSCFIAAIPTYVGGFFALGWASDNSELRKTPIKILEQRFKTANLEDCRYYTPQIHHAAFALPGYINEAIKEGLAQNTGNQKNI